MLTGCIAETQRFGVDLRHSGEAVGKTRSLFNPKISSLGADRAVHGDPIAGRPAGEARKSARAALGHCWQALGQDVHRRSGSRLRGRIP